MTRSAKRRHAASRQEPHGRHRTPVTHVRRRRRLLPSPGTRRSLADGRRRRLTPQPARLVRCVRHQLQGGFRGLAAHDARPGSQHGHHYRLRRGAWRTKKDVGEGVTTAAAAAGLPSAQGHANARLPLRQARPSPGLAVPKRTTVFRAEERGGGRNSGFFGALRRPPAAPRPRARARGTRAGPTLDDAPALPAGRQELLRQAAQLGQPIHDHLAHARAHTHTRDGCWRAGRRWGARSGSRMGGGPARTISSSVLTGLLCHEKPIMSSAAISISASTPAADVLLQNQAKKRGHCQCVTPAGVVRRERDWRGRRGRGQFPRRRRCGRPPPRQTRTHGPGQRRAGDASATTHRAHPQRCSAHARTRRCPAPRSHQEGSWSGSLQRCRSSCRPGAAPRPAAAVAGSRAAGGHTGQEGARGRCKGVRVPHASRATRSTGPRRRDGATWRQARPGRS